MCQFSLICQFLCRFYHVMHLQHVGISSKQLNILSSNYTVDFAQSICIKLLRLSVCLCSAFRKNVRTDFHETFYGS